MIFLLALLLSACSFHVDVDGIPEHISVGAAASDAGDAGEGG